MRTYDLTPFYRSTVGFDRLFSLLDQATSDGSPGYPPYNIERTGENTYRISVAVSGFSPGELSIVAKENTLTIKGEKTANENGKDKSEVLYRGIAARISSGRSPRPRSPAAFRSPRARSLRRWLTARPARSRPNATQSSADHCRKRKRPGQTGAFFLPASSRRGITVE